MADDPAKMKEELLRLLEGVGPQAQKLEFIGQEIVQFAWFSRDVAGPLSNLVAQFPEGQMSVEEWNRQLATWRDWHDTASRLHETATTVNSFGAQCYGATNATVSGVMPLFQGMLPAPPPPPALEARTKLFQTLGRHPMVTEALASMQRLGLGARSSDYRSPADLLREARSALDCPFVGEGGPVSVLITLRECIGAVISELVWRRPKQEPAKKWSNKVVSVGRQCERPNMPHGHFDRLGVDADKLMDELSGAKQATMSRDVLAEYFQRGLLLLNSLMNGIDQTRLRQI